MSKLYVKFQNKKFQIFALNLPKSISFFSRKFDGTWIMKFTKPCIENSIFKTLCSPLNTKIYIGPDNKILILRKDWRTVEESSIIFDQNGTYLYDWVSNILFSKRFYQLPPNIVHHVRKILERKNTEQYEENAKKRLRQQICKLQNDSEKLMQMMQSIGRFEEETCLKLDRIMHKLESENTNVSA